MGLCDETYYVKCKHKLSGPYTEVADRARGYNMRVAMCPNNKGNQAQSVRREGTNRMQAASPQELSSYLCPAVTWSLS
eukprot:5673385-Prymnesium_polylepis.1